MIVGSEMIERIAKEMYLSYANHPEARWEYVDPRMQEGVWKLQARAALQALMEPTPGMIEAGNDADPAEYECPYADCETHWKTMIRAALEEGEDG